MTFCRRKQSIDTSNHKQLRLLSDVFEQPFGQGLWFDAMGEFGDELALRTHQIDAGRVIHEVERRVALVRFLDDFLISGLELRRDTIDHLP